MTSPNMRSVVTVAAASAALTAACSDQASFTKVHAQIFVQPSKLEFGEALLSTSATLQVTVKDLGDDVLRLCLPGTTAKDCVENTEIVPDGTPFRTLMDHPAEDGSWIVEKGSTRKFIVTFTPAKEGVAAATLKIGHTGINGPTSLLEVSGAGVGPNVDVSPRALDFGDVAVGQRKELEIKLTNHTKFTTPATITLDDQSSVDFATLNPRGDENPVNQPGLFSIPGNAELTVKVVFHPTEEGQKMRTLSVQVCADCDKQAVALTGLGTKPVFAIMPPSIDFGQILTGDSAQRSFTVKNVGNSRLTVFSIDRDASTPKDFSASAQDMLPKTLNPNEQLAFTVSYTAAIAGRVSGRIQVMTNAWDDPATATNETIGSVALSANASGPNVSAAPSQVSFGTVMTGQEADQNLVISNAGNAQLDISSIQLITPTGDVKITGLPAFPTSLQPQAAITLALHFTPTSAGMVMASVNVSSNDRANPTLIVPVQGIGSIPNTCTIAIAPSSRTFGILDPGNSITLPIQIRSVGSQPCTLSSFSITGAHEFTIDGGGPGSITLDPNGGEEILNVTYSPTAEGSHSAELHFATNDPSLPSATVPLSGSSSPSDLKAVPSSLDFHVVPVNCRSPNRSITLLNTGTRTVMVSQAALDPSSSPEFLMGLYGTPTTIPAGTYSIITMRYSPRNDGLDTGVLFVTHDASAMPLAIPLTGEGRINPIQTDSFIQGVSAADVLFIIDDSLSAAPYQALIALNAPGFFSFAEGATLDYQIAVTTTDVTSTGEHGRFVGTVPIITPLTPSGDVIFGQNIQRGSGGSNVEEGLEGAYLALQAALQGTPPNAGFIRPNSALSIVIVSDEEDQSTRSMSDYEDFFRSIHGISHPERLTVSAIVGTSTPECMGQNGIIGSYSPRYIQIAEDTGGAVASICDPDWASTLSTVGARAFGLKKKFKLSADPLISSIVVTVDGQQISNSVWSYSAVDNTINFPDTNVPGANAQVNVTYSLTCL
jgi:centrosomal CEP192-like protein/ASPM-SPD-2-Hydin domain-containing protein/HYDIN/CFA65/VesB family protein